MSAASTTAICGNGVVEGDEECDCGWEDECHEQCCHPQTASASSLSSSSSSSSAAAAAAAAGKPCTRRRGAKCRSLNTALISSAKEIRQRFMFFSSSSSFCPGEQGRIFKYHNNCLICYIYHDLISRPWQHSSVPLVVWISSLCYTVS